MDDLEGWEWLKGMYNTQLNEESLRDKVKKKIKRRLFMKSPSLHEEICMLCLDCLSTSSGLYYSAS